MFEKVNPSHPDKICDRIGGAIVDLAYKKQENPKVAGECLLGHGNCHIIIETSVDFDKKEIEEIVERIAGKGIKVDLQIVPQDTHLADNQKDKVRCGDNGIFKGVVVSHEEQELTNLVANIYRVFPYDGKYVYDEKLNELIACQSNTEDEMVAAFLDTAHIGIYNINPLGKWTGGPNVDTGACNRKLGSDMGRAVTGGGLHFKDVSKADVAVNVYLHFLENYDPKQSYVKNHLEAECAIGDESVKIYVVDERGEYIKCFEVPYEKITSTALKYINNLGGFEKLAEWGLIRPISYLRKE